MKHFKISLDAKINHISSGLLNTQGNFSHPSRTLNHFVLLCGLKNKFEISIGEAIFKLEPGVCLLLPPNVRHAGLGNAENIAYYWMHFSVSPPDWEVVDEEQLRSAKLRNERAFGISENFVLLPQIFRTESSSTIETLFHQLIHIRKRKYYTSFATDTAVIQILIELTQQILNRIDLGSGLTHSLRLSNIISWIGANLSDNEALENIEDIFQYNKHYLSSLFLKECGVPLKKYIIGKRIEKSKVLLISTNLPVKQIASAVGYEDEKYFLRLFKSSENMTPSQYRNAFFETHIVSK